MDEHKEAYERAKLFLEAHWEATKGEHHPADAPDYAIERLLVDLMHYVHERNLGQFPDDVYYIHFDRIVADAKEQFIKQREAVPEKDEPFLDPSLKELHEAREHIEFRGIEADLKLRNLDEQIALHERQKKEIATVGRSDALAEKHRLETAAQEKSFEEEKKRYASEFLEARRLARELEQQEKDKALEPGGLDFGKK
ncbi:MAG TPA: hypothetical protein VEH47_05815 [Candidatus Acidoferrales bacterium]|nr:hypothetical protein [Candidatus Acidoferrales bacterium]